MIVIRLARTGRRNQPSFRVVVQEKTRSPKGRHLEIVGSFEAKNVAGTLQLKEDRVKHWLSVGAQPSARVHNMLVDKDIIQSVKKRATTIKKKTKTSSSSEKVAE